MNRTLKKGVILFSIGLFILINPWFYIISMLFIVPGLYHIWFSKDNLKYKIKGTLIPILVWIPLLVIFYQIFMKNKM
jgi:hypothetical protein